MYGYRRRVRDIINDIPETIEQLGELSVSPFIQSSSPVDDLYVQLPPLCEGHVTMNFPSKDPESFYCRFPPRLNYTQLCHAYKNVPENVKDYFFRRISGNSFNVLIPRVRNESMDSPLAQPHVPVTYDLNIRHPLTDNQKKTIDAILNAKSVYTNGRHMVKPIGDKQVIIYCYNVQSIAPIEKKECKSLVIANDVGTGKTLSVLYAAILKGNCLIVAPNDLIHHWKEEYLKHFVDQVHDIRFVHYKNELSKLNDEFPSVLVTSKNAITYIDDLKVSFARYKSVFFDEAHLIKMTGTSGEKLSQYLRSSKLSKFPITATPKSISYVMFENGMRAYTLNNMKIQLEMKRSFEIDRGVFWVNMKDDEVALWQSIGECFDDAINKRRIKRVHRLLERLCSGCDFDQSLIVAMIHAELHSRNVPSERKTQVTQIAPTHARGTYAEGCFICMDSYGPNGGIQYQCRDVICTSCEPFVKRCPFCRGPIQIKFKANFPDQKEQEKPNEKVEEVDEDDEEPETPKRQKKILPSKLLEFQKQIALWKSEAKDDDYLVLFMKEKEPIDFFKTTLADNGLSYLMAGLGENRKTSQKNIKQFKTGSHKVLLASTRYSAGHDLFIANNVWIFNMDTNTTKMIQCEGRVTRISQKASSIKIRTFLQKGAYDEFLYKYGSLGTGHKDMIHLAAFFIHGDMYWRLCDVASRNERDVYSNDYDTFLSYRSSFLSLRPNDFYLRPSDFNAGEIEYIVNNVPLPDGPIIVSD